MNEKRIQHQIRNFEKAIQEYSYKEPLARFLTKYYKENKQMGSSDRRMTSRLCYNYFRIGSLFADLPMLDRLVYAEFLCEEESALVQYKDPLLNDSIGQSLENKVNMICADTTPIFPFIDRCSKDIDQELFLIKQLAQPQLFIRVKRGSEQIVRQALTDAGIVVQAMHDQTLALANGTRLQDLSKIIGRYEIQDLSSQRTIDYIKAKDNESWWDACAASGGKALMFLDKFPKTQLLVSDIRMSILRNLDERFDIAKVKTSYRKKIIDLTADVNSILQGELFDGIILDVPCSGSGTWGRTPEMKAQFTEDKLKEFSQLQMKIASNVVGSLKSGKALTYITCSVYAAENEDIIQYLLAHYPLTLDRMQVLKGYGENADTMFVARLVKN